MSLAVNCANNLLDDLGVTQDDLLRRLDEIARARNALVVEGALDGSDARLNMAGKPAVITVAKRITELSRKRFSIAHELGHLEMHRWKMTLCTSADMMEWSIAKDSNKLELEANEFAAALLMPERFFASLCEEDPSIDYFKELSAQFRVSLTAAAIRYSDFTAEPIAIVFSRNGFIKWFHASDEFENMELFVNVPSRVLPGSQAALFFAGKTLSTTPKRVSADTWLRSSNYVRDASIQEQSWPMPNLDAVLTVLWVDEDLEADKDDYY